MLLNQHITSDPGICGGRPIVSGTRLRVSDVLDALASGASEAELLADFPYLSATALRACLAYAARAAEYSLIGVAA